MLILEIRHVFLRSNFFSALDLNKFPKNVKIELEEYDFTGGVKGKYADRYAKGANVVVIDPDVAKYFPDHESVNDALRGLTAIIKRQKRAEQGHGERS
jgi:hypothetical protein